MITSLFLTIAALALLNAGRLAFFKVALRTARLIRKATKVRCTFTTAA